VKAAILLIFSFILLTGPAFAEETLEDLDVNSFSKTSSLKNDDYFGYKTGDHFEWTTYERDYSRVGYGHRFEWSKTGLSRMSVCVEVDSETGGHRYRALAEEGRCQKFETGFRWYIPFEAQTSRCEEFDKLTNGERFVRIAPDESCAKPLSTFVWMKKFEGARPACNEVDAETEGAHYRRPAHDYLCEKTLNVQLAYGRKLPYLPSRAPASLAQPSGNHPEIDPRFREDPEDLVDHVHRGDDKIHQR
jgi:hypothetical protein